MKMVNVDAENDCCTDEKKKKKMKQAQLPFQRSPAGTQNIMQSKKRKLSSPLEECKSPKAIKILKKSRSKSEDSKTLDDSTNDDRNAEEECLKVTEDTDAGNVNDESYVTVSSSDNEDKEDPAESGENVEETSRKSISSSDVMTPKSSKQKQRKLTPKQQERKLLSAKKKEEREKLKMEKEKKQEEERAIRRKEKEQKLMQKIMKEMKKQQELEQKQKEKQAKEEERRKKEEEKRKKEEEELEVERKKQKAASKFTSFFVAKKQEKTVEEESTNKVQNFMPFEVKADMKLAPICRRFLNEAEKKTLYEKCIECNMSPLYLYDLKTKRIVPRKSSRTWPLEAKDDVILIDDDNEDNSNIVNQDIVIEKQRTKLLQFSENQRPPYWGTWRKRSQKINPRKPFSKDERWFNYEVDSDDEWEEEEPGESLHGSDEEKDEENPDDNEYDVDNEFMVPHGYLSDEEVRADEEDNEDMTPETQKFKLKVLGEQFESERNTKTAKLKPKIIGCIWRGMENLFLENVPPRTRDFLTAREAWVRQNPVSLPKSVETDTSNESGKSSKKSLILSKAMPELIRLVHGNTHGRKFLAREFLAFWDKKYEPSENVITKGSLMMKIREIAKYMVCPDEGPMHQKACWYVSEDIRKQHLEEDLELPNQWSYTVAVTSRRSRSEPKKEEHEKDKEKSNVPLITQFTKRITQEEMKKQLSPASASQSNPAKKRATLISIARGEQFPKTANISPLKRSPAQISSKKKDATDKDKDEAAPLAKGRGKKRKSTPKKVVDSSEEIVID
ncbi:uncharacterized protein LOC143216925 [Lasioglossum baleicum]|uniref:uncharacterized protein LOC143216925 n=1 Tax=Lasioglossum baleicum TaxID=434251 RepID=UPI003FCCF2D9